MTKLATLSLCLGLALVSARPAAAQRPEAATTQDIQRLQYDLQNLDDSLAALSPSHPRYQEFEDRANDIRDEVTYLKVLIRSGQRSRPPVLGATRSEVDELRRSIAALQDDVDSALNRRFSGSGTLPEATEIQVRLEQPLSSRTARIADRFEASGQGRTAGPDLRFDLPRRPDPPGHARQRGVDQGEGRPPRR